MTETKTRLDALIGGLEQRFGDSVAPLRLHLDGCPHACAQHWVGDIGLQGTTARDEDGRRGQAYDVYLRGALGPRAAIARPVFRRVPTQELDELVQALGRAAGSRAAGTARACGRISTGRRTRSSACWSGASRRAAGERRRPHE